MKSSLLHKNGRILYPPIKYKTKKTNVYLSPGENTNLGLDGHGNISWESDEQFPVLMGGWNYLNNKNEEVAVTDPLIIIFE